LAKANAWLTEEKAAVIAAYEDDAPQPVKRAFVDVKALGCPKLRTEPAIAAFAQTEGLSERRRYRLRARGIGVHGLLPGTEWQRPAVVTSELDTHFARTAPRGNLIPDFLRNSPIWDFRARDTLSDMSSMPPGEDVASDAPTAPETEADEQPEE
jgi:hypothetical protein